MRNEVVEHNIQCPYCWQAFDITVDCSVEHQKYIEDCEICCRPIVLDIFVTEDGDVSVDALSEDE